ncbi:hypothetical protein PF005_g33230 [Phytophthora fragariae]|uniref:Uncharacterized protein n=1 Tax=Phytophthora fragariae TaxID=53985 RepID=A0A6A3UYH2_9STRA|nr:hypothetical protein PF011_g32678 [Phytophthora fragariae]KAE9156391.1 hypothetical protein PF005_g33230 [Phytophthora fragariae]
MLPTCSSRPCCLLSVAGVPGLKTSLATPPTCRRWCCLSSAAVAVYCHDRPAAVAVDGHRRPIAAGAPLPYRCWRSAALSLLPLLCY